MTYTTTRKDKREIYTRAHLANVKVRQVRQKVVANEKAQQDPVVKQTLKVILKRQHSLHMEKEKVSASGNVKQSNMEWKWKNGIWARLTLPQVEVRARVSVTLNAAAKTKETPQTEKDRERHSKG